MARARGDKRASLRQLNMKEMILSNLLDILPPQSLTRDGNRPFSVDWHELAIFINSDWGLVFDVERRAMGRLA